MNFTTYGAWPPVTFLTGPTQAFHGQCINKSLFKFIVILLCKTYSTTLRKHPVTSSYTLQLININIYKEKGPSTESLCRSRQKSYSCHLTTRNLFYGCWGGHLPRQSDAFLGLATLEKPLELSSHRDRQPEWGASGWTLPRQSDVSLGLATLEKPMELSSHRDRQPEWGASGWTLPRQSDVSLGLATLEKPLELSSHRDRQPERGALGWNLPRQVDVSLGLATLKKDPGA